MTDILQFNADVTATKESIRTSSRLNICYIFVQRNIVPSRVAIIRRDTQLLVHIGRVTTLRARSASSTQQVSKPPFLTESAPTTAYAASLPSAAGPFRLPRSMTSVSRLCRENEQLKMAAMETTQCSRTKLPRLGWIFPVHRCKTSRTHQCPQRRHAALRGSPPP